MYSVCGLCGTCTSEYTRLCTCAYMHTCVPMRMVVSYKCAHVCVLIHVYVYVCMYIHLCMHVHVHVCIHVHVYMHVCIAGKCLIIASLHFPTVPLTSPFPCFRRSLSNWSINLLCNIINTFP